MFDQLIIDGKRSYDDFEANVTGHKITDGNKKTIKETVPFSNKVYDFSAIDGEIYWEEKTLQYTLEVTADDAEALSAKLIVLKYWLMNVMQGKLKDPYIPGYYFLATFSSISVNDDEFEKAVVTVTFTAYPYMIAKEPKQYSCDLTADVEKTVRFDNNSSHRIVPTFQSNVPFNVKIGTTEYSVPSGEVTDEYLKINAGTVELVLKSAENGTVLITFHEEVF